MLGCVYKNAFWGSHNKCYPNMPNEYNDVLVVVLFEHLLTEYYQFNVLEKCIYWSFLGGNLINLILFNKILCMCVIMSTEFNIFQYVNIVIKE